MKAISLSVLFLAFLLAPPAKADKLSNLSTGFCLDTDGKAANGSVVRMWRCATHPNQTWTMEQIDSKHYRLINHSSKFCLDTDGSKKNGGKVRMWQCANHPNQLWEVNDLPDDRYRLKNKASSYCLDTDGKAANGAVVRMWQCATHPNQTWSKLDETIREIQKLTNLSSGFCLDTDGKAANGSVVRMWQCATHPNQTWTVDRVDFKYYRLTNHSSKFCLDTDGSKKNGGKVRMWQCANHPNQLWEVNDLPDDRYRLKNKASGYCLDTDGKAANGAVVRMWQCATHPNQTWSKFDETITKIQKLANVSTGYCLDTDGKAANGSVVRMWQCATHPNQTWTVDRVDPEHYRLINHSSKFCLDTDGSKKNGGKVRMWQCANHPNQLWKAHDLPDDRYRLKNKASGYCLDTDGKAANGAVVRMWQCATHPNQSWFKYEQISALSAHGNTDWHIDTANEFLFGVDMAGNATAPNYAPKGWIKNHMHTGHTNTAKYYYDKTRIASGDDTNATNGIDMAMLFFYAGHGSPDDWDTLGDHATQGNMLLANANENGKLRYYWQCSCNVFAHGPRVCTGSTIAYSCPEEFTDGADSEDMRNVFQRWGPALSPDLHMACGVSTIAYCHESNVSKIWDNYTNKHMKVADAFIDGLTDWGTVPLCITRGGANIASTPLYESTFTSNPNQSGNTHYHILYASGTGRSPVSSSAEQAIPQTLPKFRVVAAASSARLRGLELGSGQPASLAVTAFAGGTVQARIEPASGAVYLFSDHQPSDEGRVLQERDYVERASNVIREFGWESRELGEPNVTLLLAASMPIKSGAGSIQQTQRGAKVTYRRQIEVEGKLVPVIGDGGVVEVTLNNSGLVLSASRVWRTVQGASTSNRVKRFEKAHNEAVAKLDKPDVYRLDQWRWGYKELAGNVRQDELKVVFQFAFVPKNQQDIRQYPPRLIEIEGQEN